MSTTLANTNFAAESPTLPRSAMNTGLSAARVATWLNVFGPPRSDFPRDHKDVTNVRLARLMETRQITPHIRVTGLKPALDLLEQVFAEVKLHNPALYDACRTAGMLNCRVVRGTTRTWSNHAFGGAIDLYFGKEIDAMGDGETQLGLRLLYPFFHAFGWFWGAGYRTREDSMHMELADETIRKLF